MLKAITVTRFKNIKEVSLPLSRINILVGSNNSGKSSLLQGIQFAVSVAQTLKILGATWRKDEAKLSFAPNQLIYSPLREIAGLAHNQIFNEYPRYALKVEFCEPAAPSTPPLEGAPQPDQDVRCCVQVIKGRGQNIQCTMSGANLGRRLQPIVGPFSVFVPGLAGIPTVEEQKPAATVRRAAARGDANNVFRNVLWLLKQNRTQWLQFLADFERVFPNRKIEVWFNTEQDEHIRATVVSGSNVLPIDAAGTGVLQAIQILAYINLSKPKLLVLDEPDAHLHPNNQRRLAELLVDASEGRDFQIILSTHSRHLLDALRSDARVHWIREGQRVPDADYDEIGVLLDVGALDRGDLLKAGQIKCVVLTEDDDLLGIKALLEASGFVLPETDIWSYKGCSNRETAIALYNFIVSHAPGVKVIIHRDRDYLKEEEVFQYTVAISKECSGAFVFVTVGTDLEAHFLNAAHISSFEPGIQPDQVEALIERSTEASAEYSIRKFINTRVQIEGPEKRKLGQQLDHGEVALRCQQEYLKNPGALRHGKRVFRKLRDLLQSEHKVAVNPLQKSSHISSATLTEVAKQVWSPVAPPVEQTQTVATTEVPS
ncbi:MAG TPA: AAA family ATPase [Chthoniobacterales bacterium]|nr:AAA family ATPase [Chthoniobacterales bacterium]